MNAAVHSLADTLRMGWMNWHLPEENINQDTIKEMADAMVHSGIRELRYQYVCIDDLWLGGRDESGALTPKPEKFTNGIKALADYVHTCGLKLAIYSDAGTKTCCGRPGSQGYEEIEARMFAEWEVDCLKND